MTKKLKLASLLLLITASAFAQKPQSTVNTTKNNIKGRIAADTGMQKVMPIAPMITSRSEGELRLISGDSSKKPTKVTFPPNSVSAGRSLDSLKAPMTTTEQVSTSSNIPIRGTGVELRKNSDSRVSSVGTSNDKGEVLFEIKEKGDYTFTFILPKSVKPEKVVLKISNRHGDLCPPLCKPSLDVNSQIIIKNLEISSYKLGIYREDLEGMAPQRKLNK